MKNLQTKQQIIVTGLKPTGYPHMGNYLGMLKPALELGKDKQNKCFYFIPDYHALNTVQNKDKMHLFLKEVIVTFLALMDEQDHQNIILYQQSKVPTISQAMLIIQNLCPKGMMNRAHAYKSMKDKYNGSVDEHVNMGLYNYPILMAADILVMGADLVPVGADQKQHVEYARDLIDKFNKTYSTQILKRPKAHINHKVATVSGLDGRKMSKSYNNIIPLFASENELRKLIMKIKTDSKTAEEPKDKDHLLYIMYENFATSSEIAEMNSYFGAGIGYGEIKNRVFEVIRRELEEPRLRYLEYLNNDKKIAEILKSGAEIAMDQSEPYIQEMKRAVGIRLFDC